MNEYIKVPKWVPLDILKVQKNIVSFLNNADYLDEDKIKIASLRSYYAQNFNVFLDLVQELGIRGFEFLSSKENNILPKQTYEYNEDYIYTKYDNKKFKLINFEKIMLGNFIHRFKVDKDTFFNYIPLKGFTILNPKLNIKDIEETFLAAGFEIIRNENIKKCIDKQEINSEEELDKEELMIQKNQNKENIYTNYLVEIYFAERKYELFKKFCLKYRIKYVHEIRKNHIDSFSKVPGVGVKKINEVNEKLIESKKSVLIVDEQNISEGHYIEFYFSDRKYEIFREFCLKKNITEIKEISAEIMSNFRNERGVGELKSSLVENRLIEVKELIECLEEKCLSTIIQIKDSIYDVIKDEDIISIITRFQKSYPSYNYQICDMQGKMIKEITDEYKDGNIIYETVIFLNQLKHPKTIFQEAFCALDQREQKILDLRFNEGWTLQEIGNYLRDISRERVRQIESKSIGILKDILNREHFYILLRLYLGNKKFMTKQELVNLIGEEHISFIHFIIQVTNGEKSELNYFKPLDLLYFKEFEETIDDIHRFIEEMPQQFLIDDYIEEMEIIYILIGQDLDMEKIQALLRYYGYKQYDRYFSIQPLRKRDRLEILFRDYLTEPLRIDEKGILILTRFYKKVFNEEIGISHLSFYGRLREVEELILVNKKTYLHVKHIEYDEKALEEIEEYIEKQLQTLEVLNIEEVFKKYKNLCLSNEIKNKLSLYSIIMYRNIEKYKVRHGNTLNLYRPSVKKVYKDEEKIMNFLEEHSGIANRKLILEQFKWKNQKLDNTIAKSKKIINWGLDKIMLTECIYIPDHIKEKLGSFIKQRMPEGFTTSYYLLKHMILDETLNEWIRKNNIDTNIKLANVIKAIFETIKGHTTFLYDTRSNFSSMEQVIVNKFKGITTRDEIKEFILGYEYKEVMINVILANLLRNEIYLEISRYELILARDLKIDEKVINAVKEEVNSHLGNKPYIPLSNLKGYRHRLPRIDDEFKWNPHLIRTILLLGESSFKSINKIQRDYRYDKVIVATNESKIETFEDLIIYILKNEYSDNLHEVKVYDYLASIGILKKQEDLCSKKLPQEIIKSDKLSINELGRIELLE